MHMYHDLSAYYRTIIPITQPLALERYYSDESQLDILHFLMSLLDSPIDIPGLLAIFKATLKSHVVSFSVLF